MLRRTLLMTLFAVTTVSSAQQGSVVVKDGFMTGEMFLKLPESSQRAYAMGLTDGIFLAPLYGAPKVRVEPIERCMVGMSDSQVASILSKFLRDNPDRWHLGAHTSFSAALLKACGQK